MRILSAMARLVGEQGVGATTVAHVVSRAGVSRRTFYDIFGDRQECFLATFEAAVDQVAVKIMAAFEDQTRWVDGIRAGLLELLVFLEEEPELARLCVVQTLAAGPATLKRRAEVIGQLTAVVDRGRAQALREPPPLTAESVVGAVFSVIHTRVSDPGADCGGEPGRLTGLLAALMGIIVLPYLGPGAVDRELARPAPDAPRGARRSSRGTHNPLDGLDMRVTYRTLRVLAVIAEHPGASNRDIAEQAGVADQGQISRLLTRLEKLGLVENTGGGHPRGAANSWELTPRGCGIEQTMLPQDRTLRRN